MASHKLWRALGMTALVCVIGAAAWLSYLSVQRQAMDELLDRARAQLTLFASSIRNEVSRFELVPALLATDKEFLELLQKPDDRGLADAINRKLETIATSSGASAIYVLDRQGVTKVASNWRSPGSYVGHNYRYRPYFRDALANGKGRYFGVGTTTGQPGYFMSSMVGSEPQASGVIVVKVYLEPLEAEWAHLDSRLIVSDANDVVILTNAKTWKYRPLFPLPEQTKATARDSRQYAASDLAPIVAQIEDAGSNATLMIAGEGNRTDRYRIVSLPLGEPDWTVSSLIDVRNAQRSAILAAIFAAVSVMAGAALMLAVWQRWLLRRQEREHSRMLEERVRTRTAELRDANVRLTEEISERQRANEALVAAQDEVVQAGKMSAIGQVAASIVHEVNQPIAAIKTFAASGRVLANRIPNRDIVDVLGNIERLSDKMGAIIRHLKSFARKTSADTSEPVNLNAACMAALDLLASRVGKQGVKVINGIDRQAVVRASAVRLEQVFVNLFGNALDAMEGLSSPTLTLASRRDPDTRFWKVEISDNGPGFSAAGLKNVFTPFFTTKDVGKGLGLGMALTLRIVKEFGGSISVRNDEEGGATVTLLLPPSPVLQEAH